MQHRDCTKVGIPAGCRELSKGIPNGKGGGSFALKKEMEKGEKAWQEKEGSSGCRRQLALGSCI